MKKALKFILAFVFVIGLSAAVYYHFLINTFVDFEIEYRENKDFTQLTIADYTFLDRNANGKLDPYEDARLPRAERVEDVLAKMTIQEKIHLLKGSGISSSLGRTDHGPGIPGAVGTIVPTPRLGLPTIYLSDGPAGLRIQPFREGTERSYYATAFPIATSLASTWNTSLVTEVGKDMGNEAKQYGIDVILGPGANLMRHPLTGRNFEYFSEDPLLSGKMGASMVRGIQSEGIGTSLKHFVANNQETSRNVNNVIVSERALREIYLRGFEITVKEAQPWSIMSSYNRLNGEYTSESSYLLTDVLRGDWGFEGLVMTDWYGGVDPVGQVLAGNDLIEPGTLNDWEDLIRGYESGRLSDEAIDKAASNILNLVFKTRKMDVYKYEENPDLDLHAQTTRMAAAEGMVLLKNINATLPLNQEDQIALLGVHSYNFIAGGTGSGDVNEAYTISLEQGLKNAGFALNPMAKSLYEEHFLNNEAKFEKPAGLTALFTPFTPPQISYSKSEIEELAKSADVGIFTLGRNSGEGGDRKKIDDFLLSVQERELLEMASASFRKYGKKFIVVLNIGGVIETASWKEYADAILLAWQGGQEGGNSVADLIKGKVSPSGKLPMTFPVALEDHKSHKNFPSNPSEVSLSDFIGKPEIKPQTDQLSTVDFTLYEEGVFVGYRHFDQAEIAVSYPFGHGLSYSKFQLEKPEVRKVDGGYEIKLTVENIGRFPAKEVVQLYLGKADSAIERPKKELKAFVKSNLIAPGSSQVLILNLATEDFKIWDETKNKWGIEQGQYELHIGTSSRAINFTESVQI
ncbi:glycoside hydrolase family 3 C-terminal domain-containing protein [Flavobacteriaceae bacterium]|nr:glycoside hydrolase family 3 C-terminal domain-containing protein [Flavobacteriaceae bacterium]